MNTWLNEWTKERTNGPTNWLTDWLAGSLTHALTHWLLTDALTHSTTHWLNYWLTNSPQPLVYCRAFVFTVVLPRGVMDLFYIQENENLQYHLILNIMLLLVCYLSVPQKREATNNPDNPGRSANNSTIIRGTI